MKNNEQNKKQALRLTERKTTAKKACSPSVQQFRPRSSILPLAGGKYPEKSALDIHKKPQKIQTLYASPTDTRHSKNATVDVYDRAKETMKPQKPISKVSQSKESISINKKSSSSEGSDMEVGVVKNLRSQAPSAHTIRTLSSRVIRRDMEMRKRWGISIIDDKQLQRDDKKTPQKTEKLKKPDDNYKEVFPEIKLNFTETKSASDLPLNTLQLLENASEQLSNLTNREKAPDWTKKRDDFLRKSPKTKANSSAQKMKFGSGEYGKTGMLAIEMTPSESLVAEDTPKSYAETGDESRTSLRIPTKFESNAQVLTFTGLPCVKNKNNEGKLFVNGVPFWVDNINEDVTDEENVLNAAVILEVASGKLSLVNMPDESIVLDMYADWTVLHSRDRKCFSKDVLFGNTVRSMVNLFETTEYLEAIQTRQAHDAKINVLNIDDPTMVVHYMRDDLDYLTEEEFTAHRKRRTHQRR